MTSSTPTPAPKKLYRSSTDKMLAGVCGGIAEYTGWDVALIRVVTSVLLIVGFGSVGVAYLVAWAIVPVATPPADITPTDAQ